MERGVIFTCLLTVLVVLEAPGIQGIRMADQKVEKELFSDEVKQLVAKAILKYNEDVNDSANFWRVEEIKAVVSHLADGVVYILDLVLNESTCLKKDVTRENLDKMQCQASNTATPKDVRVRIQQKPWENFEQITFDNV